jgi:protein-disulfide isomerase
MKIVKFEQPSCTQCRILDGLLKYLNLSVDETINLLTEEDYDKARALGISSTPTLILFDDNGDVIDRVSGLKQDKIKEMFAKRG